MEDEVLKHTKKIYETAKNSEHSLGEKLKEILVEIFIIVFAITLSIWLHSWTEHRQQKNEALEFLNDLKDDLAKDLKSMTDKRESLTKSIASFTQILTLSPKQIDSLHNVSLNFSLSTFKGNDGNYEGFKSSGKIGYIENKELKKEILEYYQEDLPGLYDVDKYHYAKDLEVWELINSLGGGEKMLSNPLLKAKIGLDAQISQALLSANNNAMDKINKIQKEIDKELSK